MIPIGELLKQSWELFKKNFLHVFLIGFISFVVAVVNLFSFGLAIILSGVVSITSNPENLFNPSMIGMGFLLFGLYLLVSIVTGSVFTTAMIYSVGNEDPEFSIGKALKKGWVLLVPLSLTNFIVGTLTFGGLFLFIFPAIVFSIFLAFTSYEVIFSDKKYLEAMRSSIRIVSQHFGEIFVRMLLVVGVQVFIFIIFAAMDMPNVANIINIPLSYFLLFYYFVVYKQARDLTDQNKPVSLVWFFVVAVIGWLIFFAMFSLIAKVVSQNGEKIMEAISKEIQESKKTSEVDVQTSIDYNYSLED